MRLKTDERRRAILDAAAELFRDLGYQRASMALISAKVGGSKGTLYSYFKSKDELFAAVMVDAMEERGLQTVELLDPLDDDLRGVLSRFGDQYLSLLLAPENVANTRTVIAEAGTSRLGANLYEMAPLRFWGMVADYLAQLMERGMIEAKSAEVAAVHLQGLLEAGMVEPSLFDAPTRFDRDTAVKEAVDMFLRGYARKQA